jgi:putative oligomerization/nucleic acid binding protein
VEAQKEDGDPVQVSVRNGDDRGDDLEFSAEVKDLLSAGSNTTEAQSTLGFLNESLELSLVRRKLGRFSHKCTGQFGKGKKARVATATVFVVVDGSMGPKNLTFTGNMQPEPAQWERNPPLVGGDRRDVTICWAEIEEGQNNQILNPILDRVDWAGNHRIETSIESPEKIQPFALLFIEDDAESFWELLRWLIRPADISIAASNLSGHLIVEDEDTKAIQRGSLPVQLASTAPGYQHWNFYVILLLALAAFLIAAMYLLWQSPVPLNTPLKVDFRTRWVSNLTTAAAILGTILSGGALPNDTFFMSKQQYIALNVTFGFFLILATVIYHLREKVFSFLVASATTMGAAIGVVLTVLLTLEEMQFQGSMPRWAVVLAQIILVITTGLVGWWAHDRALRIAGEAPGPITPPDLATHISHLAALRDKQLVTDAEFNSARTEILARMRAAAELSKLAKLRQEGAMDEAQFQNRKAQWLDDV